MWRDAERRGEGDSGGHAETRTGGERVEGGRLEAEQPSRPGLEERRGSVPLPPSKASPPPESCLGERCRTALLRLARRRCAERGLPRLVAAA